MINDQVCRQAHTSLAPLWHTSKDPYMGFILEYISSTDSASSQVAARNGGAAPNGSIRCSSKFPHITWLYLWFSLFYPVVSQFLLVKIPMSNMSNMSNMSIMLKLAITHLRSCCVGILWTATASRHFWRVGMPFRSNLEKTSCIKVS